MTAIRAVFAAVVVLVVVSIGLVVAGVAILAGPGWALVASGALTGPAAVAGGWAVLREGAS